MNTPRRIPRLAGRFFAGAVVARGVKRYPIVGVGLMVFRWWRRRSRDIDRTSVRLRSNETLTVRHRRDG